MSDDTRQWTPLPAQDQVLLAAVDAILAGQAPGPGLPVEGARVAARLASAVPAAGGTFQADLRARLLAEFPVPAAYPERAVPAAPAAFRWLPGGRRAALDVAETIAPPRPARYAAAPGRRARWGSLARGLAGTLLLVVAVAGLTLLFGWAGPHEGALRPTPGLPAFTLLRAIDRGVGPLAWSPDGRQLAAVDANAIVLWDVAGGRRVRSMDAPAALSVAWSPAGQTLAVGSGGNGIWLIDPATGQRRGQLGAVAGKVRQPSQVASLAWSPDGQALAAADEWQGLTIWNTQTGQAQLHIPTGRAQQLSSVAWSPDGRQIAAMVGAAAQLWDATTGQAGATLGPLPPVGASSSGNPDIPPPQSNRNYSLAWAADGRRLALVGPGSLQVWDIRSRRVLQTMSVDPLPANPVYPLAWWAGDRWLLGPAPAQASPQANAVGLWDPATGQAAAVLPLGAPRIEAFVPSPDGRLLAVASGADLAIWGAPGALPAVTPNSLPTPTLWQLGPTETVPVPPGSPTAPLPAPFATANTGAGASPVVPATPHPPPPAVTPTPAILQPAELITPTRVSTVTLGLQLGVTLERTLAAPERLSYVTWASAGDKLLYLTESGKLYWAGVDGSNATLIPTQQAVNFFSLSGGQSPLGNALVLPGTVLRFAAGQAPRSMPAPRTQDVFDWHWWSPNRASGIRYWMSSQIGYVGGDRLVTVDAQGQVVEERNVPYMAAAAVQPGGMWLAYVTGQQSTNTPLHDPPETVYLLNLSSGRRLQLSPAGQGWGVGNWSPDGTWLTMGACGSRGCGDLLARQNGQEWLVIQTQTMSALDDLAWSPDSTRVAWSEQRGGCDVDSGCTPETSDIYVVDVRSQKMAHLLLPGTPAGNHSQLLHPQWSPDGRHLAVLAYASECGAGHGCSGTHPAIYILGVTTGAGAGTSPVLPATPRPSPPGAGGGATPTPEGKIAPPVGTQQPAVLPTPTTQPPPRRLR